MQAANNSGKNPLSAMLPCIFGDVLVYASETDPGLFLYLPLSPSPVLTTEGKPSGQLIAAGEQSFLMIAAQWDVTAERLEALRRELTTASENDPDLQNVGPVRLAFANVSEVNAELRTARSNNSSPVLARSGTTGLPPYSALFNITLAGDDREAALAAMSGHRDVLFVRFSGYLSTPLQIKGRFEGDFSAVTDAASLQTALEKGRVRFTCEDAASATFKEQLCARALEILSIKPDRQGATTIDVRLETSSPVHVSVSADVGAWFAGSPSVLPAP